MTSAQILEETPITMTELKEEINNIKKRDKELNFRAQRVEEYLKEFAKFEKTKELNRKLLELNIPRLKNVHIVKIMDILPTTVNDLKVVLTGYPLSINSQNLKKIVDTINEFLK